MVLPVTCLYAGLLALLYVWLARNVIRLRYRHRVTLLDGGHDELSRAIRAHANFAEYVPFLLILLALLEINQAPAALLHLFGMGTVIARSMHAYSLSVHEVKTQSRRFRFIGMVITFSLLIVMGGALVAAYIYERM